MVEIISLFSQVVVSVVMAMLIAIGTAIIYSVRLPAAYLQIMLRMVAGQRDVPEEQPEHADEAGPPPPPGAGEPGARQPGTRQPGTRPAEPGAMRALPRPASILIHQPGGPYAQGGLFGPAARSDGNATADRGGRAGPGRPARGIPRLRTPQMSRPLPPGRRRNAWPGHHVDENVAMPSYFFGPLADDAIYVCKASVRRAGAILQDGVDLARDRYDYFGMVGRTGIMLGIVPGGIAGASAMAAVAMVHLTVSALTAALAACAGVLIRAADASRRLVGGITMTCPSHGTAVTPYPVYVCPRCGNRHRDIRPGRHGITRRICNCREPLPTSLLLGTGTLAAECPDCGAGLPESFGAVPQVVIPFVGAGNVGKTQLMYRLYQTLSELVPACGGTISLESDSKERLDQIGLKLRGTRTPGKTAPELPRAYVLHLTLGSDKRQIYFFDAAGELHYERERLRGLSYLGKARSMVFVADPLAADSVWSRLPVDSQRQLAYLRSHMSECELAYQQTREQMRRMGSKRRFARLAFVVSKADLVAKKGVVPRASSLEIQQWIEDPEGLDLGNIVRESLQSFADVKFFQTAAVMAEDGLPDESVEILAWWLLKSDGIRLERGSYGT